MVTYTKLWKLLIDKHMKKKDLISSAGISTYILYKMNHNENVTTDVLAKICNALQCSFDDIMEIIPDDK